MGIYFPSFDIALASRNGRQPAYAITQPSRPYSHHSSLTVSENKNFVVIAVEFLTLGIENWKQEVESPTHLARTSYGIRTIFPRKGDERKPNAVLVFARLDDLTLAPSPFMRPLASAGASAAMPCRNTIVRSWVPED